MLFVGVEAHDDEDQISGQLIRRGAVAGDIAAPPVWDPATEAIYLLRSGDVSRPAHSWPGLHLAISTGGWCDADIVIDPGTEELDALWEHRLVPFEANLRTGRRAPRRQRAVLADPDPTWPQQAQRLMERLLFSVGGMIIRADHIGSTSVPGLPAKQLIDIQVLVDAPALARPVADAASRSGFVRVPGNWFGTDQRGVDHPEEVVVDADPGRPVNINIRTVTAPIWRETLLFRDWLRAHQGERAAYAELKAGLAGRRGSDIDDYGTDKMRWISSALIRAGQWAAWSNWSPWETY